MLTVKEFITMFRPYPDHPKVKAALNRLIENNPEVQKVYLTGSFLRGDWIDEETDDVFIAIKKTLRGKAKISDVDFITEPIVPSTKHYDVLPNRRNKLLIYDKGQKKI